MRGLVEMYVCAKNAEKNLITVSWNDKDARGNRFGEIW